ncbi:Translationally-controlled tumor protein-like protein [Rhodotorula toruloides]|uniref:Translationally-controlled tumor protein homolog n=1 Tax=Rhodotorula toruloides TaxID=5286 RepID=A0A0K3C766_RHOTO|nr:Translationally-controlled tumor protein-like protein [Rhodotorula toruloides]PRQ77461.1 Translationally controlled tumor protein [Rhodotorula toruloides]
MLLYTDAITNDELISDAYDLKEVDDVVYEADCAMITIKEGEVNIGANASAEEAEETLEEGEQRVNNVVHSFRLTETSFDKKSYMTYLKGYMKAVKAHLQETKPDRVPAFEKGAATFAKKVLGSFNDWQFFTGESMNPDGMVVLMNYREDGVTPYMVFWKDGMKEVKL